MSSLTSRRSRSGTVIGPKPDLEHLNIPKTRRSEIIAEPGEVLGNESVPAAFWAFCQVCHLDRLR